MQYWSLFNLLLAPSSFGIQPYTVTVIRDKKLKDMLVPLHNESQVLTCSHLLVFSADTDIDRRVDELFKVGSLLGRQDLKTDRKDRFKKKIQVFLDTVGPEWSAKQAYIALGFAMMTCAELQVDSCPMEVFDPRQYKQILDLPNNLEPKVLLALGYRSESDPTLQRKKVRLLHDYLFDQR